MNDAPLAEASAHRSKRVLVPLLLAAAAVVYSLDQISKSWVVANLTEGETVSVLGDVLQWHFVRNPGAAFSMASGATWIFTLLAAAVVVVIVWQIRKLRSFAWAIFFGLLLGGVLGNLTDRLLRPPGFPEGHVVDFILTPWMWLGFNPAIYNVADIGIVTAMGLFLIVTLMGIPLDGSPRVRRSRVHSEDSDSGLAAETVDDTEAALPEEADTAAHQNPLDRNDGGKSDGTT